jgi:hypothetical protein
MSILNLNSPQGRGPRGKKTTKIWMGVGLLAAVLGFGSTFASTITINSANESTEFGQGVERTVFCGGDSAIIKVVPITAYRNKSGSTDPAGIFYLSGIKVSGIPDACDGVNFVLSMYNGTAGSSALPLETTTARSLTTPTVYWRAGLTSANYFAASSNSSSFSTLTCTDGQSAHASNKISSTYGGILSLDRDKYSNPCSMAYLTVSSQSFQINFKTDALITNSDVATAARVVVETQEDSLGMSTGLKTSSNGSGSYGLVHSGSSS